MWQHLIWYLCKVPGCENGFFLQQHDSCVRETQVLIWLFLPNSHSGIFLTSVCLCRADFHGNGISSHRVHRRSDVDINSMSETASFFHPVSSLSHSLMSSSSFLQMSHSQLGIFLASPSIFCLQRFGFITTVQCSEAISSPERIK